ncbi:MAG: DnaA/Hda family protein [Planctomycetaceae bacterium]|nr:DnaA/Hda family protein [Planctomycetaceae bacterium]
MRTPPGYSTAKVEQIPIAVRETVNGLKETNKWPLYLCGPVGTGKTMTAAVLYGKFPSLPMWHRADDLLTSVSTGRVSRVSVDKQNEFGEVSRGVVPFPIFASRVASASCLFLDDLGTRRPTEGMCAALFDLLEWRKGRPIVITSNKQPDELTQSGWFDDRIYSRFAAGTVIKIEGSDRRATGKRVRIKT